MYAMRIARLARALALYKHSINLCDLGTDSGVLMLMALILFPLGVALYKHSINLLRVKTFVEWPKSMFQNLSSSLLQHISAHARFMNV